MGSEERPDSFAVGGGPWVMDLGMGIMDLSLARCNSIRRQREGWMALWCEVRYPYAECRCRVGIMSEGCLPQCLSNGHRPPITG